MRKEESSFLPQVKDSVSKKKKNILVAGIPPQKGSYTATYIDILYISIQSQELPEDVQTASKGHMVMCCIQKTLISIKKVIWMDTKRRNLNSKHTENYGFTFVQKKQILIIQVMKKYLVSKAKFLQAIFSQKLGASLAADKQLLSTQLHISKNTEGMQVNMEQRRPTPKHAALWRQMAPTKAEIHAFAK